MLAARRAPRPRRAALQVCLAAGLAAAASVAAPIRLVDVDAADVGFNDASSVEPVGDNPGETLGEQRWNAVSRAARLWEEHLSGDVPVVVNVSFAPTPALPCTESDVVLAQSAATTHADNGDISYPISLANQLAGTDLLAAGSAHVVVQLNDALGDRSRCARDAEWYYGLDGAPPARGVDLVTLFAHELAHGLGFTTQVELDQDVGVLESSRPGIYDRFVFDGALGKSLHEMSAAERAAALARPLSLVWTGGYGRRAAAEILARGLPRAAVRRDDGSWLVTSDLVGELVGAELDDVSAPLATVPSEMLCIGRGLVTGHVIVVDGDLCSAEDKVLRAVELGAAAVLIQDVAGERPEPIVVGDGADPAVDVPALAVGASDYAALVALADGQREARVYRDVSRLVGADARGRPYLHTGTPVVAGQTLTHVDSMLRRRDPIDGNDALLMEASGVGALGDDLGLAPAFLRDLGWATLTCGNGRLDAGEECDSGPDRSDHLPGRCRHDCRFSTCGDAAIDEGEQCDDGELNSDDASNGCRRDCQLPRCGDGVVDFLYDEECDGDDDCRSDCTARRCGDGIVDDSEGCDEGSANGEGDCSVECTSARCGNGNTDADLGEECDDGNTTDGDDCSATCRVESNGADAGTQSGRGGSGATPPGDGGIVAGAANSDGGARPGTGPGFSAREAGCGCHVGTRPSHLPLAALTCVVTLAGFALRRRPPNAPPRREPQSDNEARRIGASRPASRAPGRAPGASHAGCGSGRR